VKSPHAILVREEVEFPCIGALEVLLYSKV
jgi:hypothetical protein